MTNLFAAVFWLIAALINTGGNDDSLRNMSRSIGPDASLTNLRPVLTVGPVVSGQWVAGSSDSSQEGVGLDVLPALPVATVYSIPVYGLSNDGTVVPAQVTPTLVATMEAEAPKALSITDIICSFSWPCWEAISVATCESGLNPYAENPSGAQGLFQMMRQFHTWRYHGGNWFDPMTNARAAYSLWAESGTWYHWVCKP